MILDGSTILFGGCAASLQTQNTPPVGAKTADANIVLPPASASIIVLRMSGSSVATTASDWPRVQTEWREAMQGASYEADTASSMKP
ncbi:hypothetical protein AWB81_05369 [Caballeronia arationis]|uniref:hypothetical protein n=1 Tax=Caballeronia arationis TaxID=1777142 RepID=UPI00074BDF15|nr:hypothetical protein [Caballeronia arationis]SAK96266.1 hypothetical protein AWB81_05369 [Caballeronia arationis]